jgi:hypothetical protein
MLHEFVLWYNDMCYSTIICAKVHEYVLFYNNTCYGTSVCAMVQ